MQRTPLTEARGTTGAPQLLAFPRLGWVLIDTAGALLFGFTYERPMRPWMLDGLDGGQVPLAINGGRRAWVGKRLTSRCRWILPPSEVPPLVVLPVQGLSLSSDGSLLVPCSHPPPDPAEGCLL